MSTSLNLCLRLFPYVMCIESDGAIGFVSPKLAARLGFAAEGSTLTASFTVLSPARNSLDCSVITQAHIGKLFLMHTHDKRFALRGQIVDGELEGRNVFFFVGAPWSSWLYENGRRLSLEADEFPIQDSQLEHQMYLTTQKIMRADQEELAEELSAARVRAEEASRAKTEFVKHISHEIRTPLNGVITSLALLADPSQSLQHERLLEIANSSAHALMELVDDVLDFARIEEGQTTHAASEFDLGDFAREIEAAFSARAIQRDIRMRFFLANELPQRVRCDRRSLQKICFNLISNAIKYSQSALLEVKLSLVAASGDGETQPSLVFECIDYGIGIPEEHQAKVFEPFWTSKEVKQSNEQSTGLGLAITRELASLLGGELRLESEVGKGATFTARIPLTVVDAPARDQAAPTRRTLLENAQTFSGRALLVDDNSINLELGKLLLERLGLDVVVAENGQLAVDAARSSEFDIVFMDISMPVMGGIEATRSILALADRANSVIIAFTANASLEDIESYRQAGMLDTLIKPVEQQALRAICEAYLEPRASSSVSPAPATDSVAGDAVMTKPEDSVREDLEEDAAVLDASCLEQLSADIGEANFDRIAQLFISETRARTEQLSPLLVAGELVEIGAAAHRLASSCLAFGLLRLGGALRDTENQAKAGTPPALSPAALDALADLSLAALAAHLTKQNDTK